jgi:hypothetical protein
MTAEPACPVCEERRKKDEATLQEWFRTGDFPEVVLAQRRAYAIESCVLAELLAEKLVHPPCVTLNWRSCPNADETNVDRLPCHYSSTQETPEGIDMCYRLYANILFNQRINPKTERYEKERVPLCPT